MARSVEAVRGSGGGARASDYAGMSNEKPGENPGRRNPKVSRGRFVRPGSAGPKPRPKGAGDGHLANIPELPGMVITDGESGRESGGADGLPPLARGARGRQIRRAQTLRVDELGSDARQAAAPTPARKTPRD